MANLVRSTYTIANAHPQYRHANRTNGLLKSTSDYDTLGGYDNIGTQGVHYGRGVPSRSLTVPPQTVDEESEFWRPPRLERCDATTLQITPTRTASAPASYHSGTSGGRCSPTRVGLSRQNGRGVSSRSLTVPHRTVDEESEFWRPPILERCDATTLQITPTRTASAPASYHSGTSGGRCGPTRAGHSRQNGRGWPTR